MKSVHIITVVIAQFLLCSSQPVEERGDAVCDVTSAVMSGCSLNIDTPLNLQQATSMSDVTIVCSTTSTCITSAHSITMLNVQVTSAAEKGTFLFLRKGADLMATSLTVSGFKAPGRKLSDGAVLYADAGGNNIILNSCTFKDNTAAEFGGALYLKGVTLVMSHCTFIRNAAPYGGGAMALYSSTASISTTKFRGSSSTAAGKSLKHKHAGGALYLRSVDLTMTDSTFEHNFATWEGGAIVTYSSKFVISRTVFSDNEAGAVGATAINDSDAVLSECTFNANIGHEYGGAIAIWYNKSALTLKGNTFKDNKAPAGKAPDYYCEAEKKNTVYVTMSPKLTAASIWDEGGFCNTNMN